VAAHRSRTHQAREQVRKFPTQPTSGACMAGHDNPNLTHPASGSGVQELLRVLPLASDEAPKIGQGGL
jgi:hypothetical protein